MDDINIIKSTFDSFFGKWGITLNCTIASTDNLGAVYRMRGEGWLIWYLFGEENGLLFMDYYACHRMTNDRHVRILGNGDVYHLPALSDMCLTDSDDPEEQAREETEFEEENTRILAMLHAKGFDVEGV